jgi:hypothetical protein
MKNTIKPNLKISSHFNFNDTTLIDKHSHAIGKHNTKSEIFQ